MPYSKTKREINKTKKKLKNQDKLKSQENINKEEKEKKFLLENSMYYRIQLYETRSIDSIQFYIKQIEKDLDTFEIYKKKERNIFKLNVIQNRISLLKKILVIYNQKIEQLEISKKTKEEKFLLFIIANYRKTYLKNESIEEFIKKGWLYYENLEKHLNNSEYFLDFPLSSSFIKKYKSLVIKLILPSFSKKIKELEIKECKNEDMYSLFNLNKKEYEEIVKSNHKKENRIESQMICSICLQESFEPIPFFWKEEEEEEEKEEKEENKEERDLEKEKEKYEQSSYKTCKVKSLSCRECVNKYIKRKVLERLYDEHLWDISKYKLIKCMHGCCETTLEKCYYKLYKFNTFSFKWENGYMKSWIFYYNYIFQKKEWKKRFLINFSYHKLINWKESFLKGKLNMKCNNCKKYCKSFSEFLYHKELFCNKKVKK